MPSCPTFRRCPFECKSQPLHAGEHHVTTRFIVQIDAGFQTAERGTGNFFDHAIDQLIKIEDGRDSLRSLLQPLQVCNDFIAGDARRNLGRG